MNAIFIIGVIGVAFGILATYLLLRRAIKNSNTLYFYPPALTFCISWVLLMVTLTESRIQYYVPHLFRTGVPVAFFLGPIAYLYIRAFIKKNTKLSKFNLLHILPGVLVFIDTMPVLLKSAEEKRALMLPYLEDPRSSLNWNEGALLSSWLTWLVGIHVLLYATVAMIQVYQHSAYVKKVKEYKLSLREFKWLLSVALCLALIALAYLWSVFSSVQNPLAYTSFAFITGLSFLALNFMLFEKPDILYGLNPKNVASVMEETHKEEHKYIPFEEPQMSLYAEQLKQFLMQHKPFLNNAYSLDKLAQDTEIGRHHLSIVINQGLGMKYNEMINRYRIEYLIQHYRQVNEKNLTIEGIASEVGFNSRTTFLHSVKKFTGLTPTEFVKQLENNKTFDLPDLTVNM